MSQKKEEVLADLPAEASAKEGFADVADVADCYTLKPACRQAGAKPETLDSDL